MCAEERIQLPNEVMGGIERSYVFLIFLVDGYFEDWQAKLELEYAMELNKPVLVVYRKSDVELLHVMKKKLDEENVDNVQVLEVADSEDTEKVADLIAERLEKMRQ